MKKLAAACLLTSALVACGGKSTKATTPDPKAGSTEAHESGSATGGATYGGGTAMPAPATDPCEAK